MSMSMTTHALERNIHVLHINIQDLKNEMASIENTVLELQHQLSCETAKLEVLRQRMNEKTNLLHTLEGIQSFRKREIEQDHELQLKVVYSFRCMEYLRTYSLNVYSERELLMDEMIEYAHKLHFIRCIQRWIVEQPLSHVHHDRFPHAPNAMLLEYPEDEQHYDMFEMSHALDEQYVYLCSRNHTDQDPSTMSDKWVYVIPYERWHALYEYKNEMSFTIDSDAGVLPTIVERIPYPSSFSSLS